MSRGAIALDSAPETARALETAQASECAGSAQRR